MCGGGGMEEDFVISLLNHKQTQIVYFLLIREVFQFPSNQLWGLSLKDSSSRFTQNFMAHFIINSQTFIYF